MEYSLVVCTDVYSDHGIICVYLSIMELISKIGSVPKKLLYKGGMFY